MPSGAFTVEHDGPLPVRLRWQPGPDRELRPCPRSWPHEPHGPWFTGEAYHPLSNRLGAFDCPGVPFPADLGSRG